MSSLHLSRKEGQSIVISTSSGETIEIVCLGTKKGVTRLVFNANKSIKIHRQELYEKLVKEDNGLNLKSVK